MKVRFLLWVPLFLDYDDSTETGSDLASKIRLPGESNKTRIENDSADCKSSL